ncbi:hypothetical protein [Paracoccus shanxieyensis]|uniref:Flagellar protein FlgN n=1 Tax=Paracoccus shanxieyensis TaxID=2675752 RepID=A0A6L6IYD6_9RHOB|nr:hypothetical protein [Paracoccus shanxieyensis]MTH64631.1 hypothetical protein [Paracoccus shanxieyensis]MTH87775.1 hypothetical protein [Paracoccus shanxieyensis]
MIDILKKLQEARQAVQDVAPDRAAAILHEIEAKADFESLPDRDAVLRELRAIREHSDAAAAGIAAAQKQIAELMRLGRSLGTYDRAGNMQVNSTQARQIRKY